jgi:hypothetical protein
METAPHDLGNSVQVVDDPHLDLRWVGIATPEALSLFGGHAPVPLMFFSNIYVNTLIFY